MDAVAGGPSETVRRPDPGLARGVWEAPPWLFVVIAVAAALALVVVLLQRAGLLRRLRPRRDEAARSSRRPGPMR